MRRTNLLLALVFALPGCGSSDSAPEQAVTTRPDPSPSAVAGRADDRRLSDRVFSRRAFESCVDAAWTTAGVFLVTADGPPRWRLRAADGVVRVSYLVTDVATGGPVLGFAANAAEAEWFAETVSTLSSKPNAPFAARAIVIRRRGNVAFFYRRSAPAVTVDVVESCLGGRPWQPPPGPPPDTGLPYPPGAVAG